ncbi:MAG: hypothetical protein U0939_12980 [Pirellulales bacterium]
MNSPAELHQMLDACRPEHADWNEPEMTALAAALAHDDALNELQLASQAFDRAVQSQIADLPVPAGLAQRLLAQLTAPEAASTEVGLAEPAAAAFPPVSRRARRVWLSATAAAACLTLALSGVWWWSHTVRPPASAEELAAAASEWGTALQQSETWNSALEAAPREYAPSRQVRAKALGWQTMSTPFDRQATSYALQGPLSDGWLIVLRSSASFLPSDDRPRKLPTTGAWAVHAWVEGPQVFILVTRDRPRHAEQFLAPRELAGNFKPTHAAAAG